MGSVTLRHKPVIAAINPDIQTVGANNVDDALGDRPTGYGEGDTCIVQFADCSTSALCEHLLFRDERAVHISNH